MVIRDLNKQGRIKNEDDFFGAEADWIRGFNSGMDDGGGIH